MRESYSVISFHKNGADMPWYISLFINGYTTSIPLQGENAISVGNRLANKLKEYEGKISSYPFEISFTKQADKEKRSVNALVIGEEIGHIEATFGLLRHFSSGRITQGKVEYRENPFTLDVESSLAGDVSLMANVSEKVKLANDGYVLIGRALVDDHTDGDTVKVEVAYTGKDLAIGKGQVVGIRYLGIQTPETKKDGSSLEGYADNRNASFAQYFNVTEEQAYEVAEEGGKKNKELVGNKWVIVNVDRDVNGTPIKSYDRYLGIVYATGMDSSKYSADDVLAKLKKESSFVNIPKTMLTTYSKKYEKVPLAYMEYDDYIAGYDEKTGDYSGAKPNTSLNPITWVDELGLEIFDPGSNNKSTGIVPSAYTDEKVPRVAGIGFEESDVDDTPESMTFEYSKGYISNSLDFVKPLDDRFDEIFTYIDDEEYQKDSRVRIGDVLLTIPPLSIKVDKVANIQKTKTLRTKSSVITNAGATATTLTLDLYFHDIDTINGAPKKYEDYVFYMDGLRPLLAQFNKCPFVPIDNPYVNNVLGIHSVALLDMTVQTVPGFPHSLSATVTLVKFDADAYLIDTPYLGDAINYPLMRWYYQSSMTDRGVGRTYFQPVEEITNDFTFSLASKDMLEARMLAFKTINQMDAPDTLREATKNGDNSLGLLKQDAKRAQEILDKYNKYKKLNVPKEGVIEKGNVISKLKSAYKDKYKLSDNQVDTLISDGEYYFDKLYDGGKPSKSGTEFYPYETPIFYDSRFGKTYTGTETPTSYQTGQRTTTGWDESLPDVYDGVDAFKDHKGAGFAQIGFASAKSMDNFPDSWRAGKKIDGLSGYYIPMTEENVSKLKKVAGQNKEVNNILDDYEENYNQQLAIIESTEAEIEMNEYPIEGLLPTSLNVMYSNEFAKFTLREGTTPSLQYLGSQDPYIQVVFEVDDEGLKKLNQLLETLDEYSRTYRMGISSGFLDVNNSLANLFGIRSVMVESARFSTVPGYPGRNQVQMTMVGFNKTQSRTEALKGLNASSSGDSLKDRKMDSGDRQERDDIAIEMKMRSLEVYPDLELPSYDELNKAIKAMKLNMDEYPNRTGGFFVDPDFYVSTPLTFRDIVDKQHLEEHATEMNDATGLVMKTSTESDRVVDADDDTWGVIQQLTKNTARVDSAFSWGDSEAGTATTDYDGDGNKEPVTYKDEKIGKYMTERGKDGTFGYENPPSFETWKSWASWKKRTQDQYEKWLSDPNPTEYEVFKQLYNIAKPYFSKLGDVKLSASESASDSRIRAAYSGSSALYAVVFDHNRDELSSSEGKSLDKRFDAGELKEPKIDKSKCSEKDFKAVGYKIPFERVFGTIKALMQYASNWKQFDGKRPKVDSAKNSCGITGAPLAEIAGSVEEAERLMWDWEYNLAKGMEKIKAVYDEAVKLDKVTKIELRSRPWDCMVYAYKNGKQPDTEKALREDATVGSVQDIFYKNYAGDRRWGTPTMAVNSDIYAFVCGLSAKEKKALNKDYTKKEMVDILVDDLGYLLSAKEVQKYWDDQGKSAWSWDRGMAEGTKAILMKKSKSAVKDIFNKRLAEIKKDQEKWDKIKDNTWAVADPFLWLAEKEEQIRKNSPAIDGLSDDPEVETLVNSVGAVGAAVDNAKNNRLVGSDDPKQLYREMFNDMRENDQRGRLLRAFPAFQMFIIDEGRWMSNYRFWDNLYGFNAINSIDVYRSRKIAADTAVIEMTNVYSNLTSKRFDIPYEDHKASIWSNLIFEKPTEELLDSRNELLKAMMLETGARIHLRMGYGADAGSLPTVFNGTITEIDSQDIIQITCQGDGLELGNIVSGDPDDDNKGYFKITEPRDLICQLLTSKGNWFRDVINSASNGVFMKENPLGIMHFGVPGEKTPAGNISWFNSDYGEAAQNIYSSNGTPTFSQWTHPDGSKRSLFADGIWNTITSTNMARWFQPGDEDNVAVKFYNNTTWDIIQTLTYCSLDYIAAVHPFETRSTLFFGKPYWRMAHSYDSQYEWDSGEKGWARKITGENRRPYMQWHYYDSTQDIIDNKVRASEEGVFTNVIVQYGKNYTPVLSADYDIRFDKQKTQVVEAEIVARMPGLDFFKSEYQARNYGMTALKYSLRDMYKGGLLVMGDPSVKPHDAMFFNDTPSTMNGVCLVKSVTHHFSHETGFVTNVEPDAWVVNDDLVMTSLASWGWSAAAGFLGSVMSVTTAKKALRRITGSRTINKLVSAGKDGFGKLEERAVKMMLDSMDNDIPEFKAYKNAFEKLYRLPKGADKALRKQYLDEMDKAASDLKAWLKSSKANTRSKQTIGNMKFLARKTKALSSALRAGKAGKAIFTSTTAVVKGGLAMTGVGIILDVVFTAATEGLFEMYSRWKEALQCVIILPLRYRGKEFTAGINGHKGAVVGDKPGKLDSYVSATFGEDDGDAEGWISTIFETLNFASGSDKSYSHESEE